MTRTLKSLTELPKLFSIFNVSITLVNESNEDVWAWYIPDLNKVMLYTKDEEGNKIDYDLLIKSLCHELAHHLQHQRGLELVHDYTFIALLWQLLQFYYEGEIPSKLVNMLEEEEEVFGYGKCEQKPKST